MATATTEPLSPAAQDRVATLEAALERSERRREAAEEWADFLEAELAARDERLQAVISQYERQLEAAKDDAATDDGGLWARLARLF